MLKGMLKGMLKALLEGMKGRSGGQHGLGAAAAISLLIVGCSPQHVADGGGDDAGAIPSGDDAWMPDDDATTASPPSLTSAEVRVSGRFGEDLHLSVLASDPDGDATSIALAIFDGSGQPILQFDSDGDGLLDSNETLVSMNAPITGAAEGSAEATLVGFYADVPALDAVDVRVVDALGAASPTQHVTVTPQTIVEIDGLCDPTYAENRCADGLGCPDAVPAVCVAGQPPTLSRVSYLTDAGAVRVLVQGLDADDDVSSLVIAFFDASGDAVTLDLDGDGTPESVDFRTHLRAGAAGGSFFYAFDASDAFAAEVAAVTVTALDRGMHESEPVRAVGAPAPTRSSGQACDALGFDRCVASVCLGTGTSYRCTLTSTARSTECRSAPRLDAFAGGFVEGDVAGPSLWDAPAGCSSGDPVGRPETAVSLHLDRPASRVELSTDNAYTSFDTTLYVLTGCAATAVVAWCADDTPSSARSWLSHLTLLDVPAGDYMVVVDSFSPAGGRYRLEVTATE